MKERRHTPYKGRMNTGITFRSKGRIQHLGNRAGWMLKWHRPCGPCRTSIEALERSWNGGNKFATPSSSLSYRRLNRVVRATPPVDENAEKEIVSSVDDSKLVQAPGKALDLVLRVGAALAFGFFLDYQLGFAKAEEYFTGYILEQTLSVDNLFVFILLFNYFKVPEEGKDRVLNFGIFSAAVLRGILILLGSEIIDKFEPVLLVFAGILLYSAYEVLSEGEEDEEDFSDNSIVKFCKRFLKVCDDYDGDKFFTVENGVKQATPLLLVLAVVEFSDLIFAVDSIPAVFGVTKDPLIVYSSNMFAIISLRSLFGFVSSAMAQLKYLNKSVGIVLGFVGAKMIADFGGIHITNSQSLLVVCSIVGVGIVLSLAAEAEEA